MAESLEKKDFKQLYGKNKTLERVNRLLFYAFVA